MFLNDWLQSVLNLARKGKYPNVSKCMQTIPLNTKNSSILVDYRNKFNYLSSELQRLYTKIARCNQTINMLKKQLFSLKKEASIISLSEYKKMIKELNENEVSLETNVANRIKHEKEFKRVQAVVDREPCEVFYLNKNNNPER